MNLALKIAVLGYFVLFPYGFNLWTGVTVVLVLASLVQTKLLNKALFWASILAVHALYVALHYFAVDNHEFLRVYVLGLLLIAVGSRETELRWVLRSSHLILALCFLFTLVSRFLSSDFLSSDFYYYTLLTDSRFSSFVRVFSSLSREQLEQNYNLWAQVAASSADSFSVPLNSDPVALKRMAFALTWGSLFLDFSILLSSLLSFFRKKFLGVFQWAITLFIVLTFVVAPVLGFAWLIACLGLAAATGYKDNRRAKQALATLGFVFVLRIIQILSTL